ncbi:helix-turn-helix transcriptional regulator [Paenibacillus pasadenensis]|uniref:winged helix-turn-helix transcriptional regulator n=1 Tax=Paenibacillus pasadenensis TaxID=217090 RepID=UPI0020417555|nr:helix-turn-helix domain-containing protein [Paenibacillus pasadenensis]MCM3747194.1 helix-turn-helix transcriptional regulator [Paenibacillus pasadenensis]
MENQDDKPIADTRRYKYMNEFDATMQMIQGKWKVMLLYELYEQPARRFGELMKYIDGISHKTLTKQLRELEAHELLTRTLYSEVPARVEYNLSDKGRSLIPLLEMICKWGLANVDRNEMERLLCEEENDELFS